MPVDWKPRSKRATTPRRLPVGDVLLASSAVPREAELDRLKGQIRANERIWAGFRTIELGMIGAHSLRDFVSVVARDLPRTFPRVDAVTLACFDPEYELTRLLAPGDLEGGLVSGMDEVDPTAAFVNLSQDALRALFPASLKPRLGPCDGELQAMLFPTYARPLGSVALAPLVLRDQLIGCLNQASLDRTHFAPGTATDLLEHLAAVTAMCLDNAVNHERLRLYGLMDPLTGVANRRFFERRLSEEIERWFRRQEPLVYMLVDIDHFKQVNDQHGHKVGDRVLQQVAELLGRDLRGADLLARYGGEEFMLLLPNTGSPDGVKIAQRLCRAIAGHRFDGGDGPLAVTVSIGVACLDQTSEFAGQSPAAWLFEHADAALYDAKQSGRNRVVANGPAGSAPAQKKVSVD